jgi:hypothetical protein
MSTFCEHRSIIMGSRDRAVLTDKGEYKMRQVKWVWASILFIVGVVGMPTYAGPAQEDVELRVLELIPKTGTISASEPLVAKLQARNLTTRKGSIGDINDLNFRVVVYDRSGKLVGATPIKPLPSDMLQFGREFSPGQARVTWVALSAFYQFTKPGDYVVHVQMLNLDQARAVRVETVTRVLVLPFNAARLRARCEEIFSPLRSFSKQRSIPTGLSSFPMLTRLEALYSIRNDAVLPYMSLIAREWKDSSEIWPAVLAIRRVGSRKSNQLLIELTKRDDRAGLAARQALKLPQWRIDEPDETRDTWQ